MRERMKEVMLLLRIQAYRLCGVNALLHSRDKRQRRHALGQLGIGLLLAVIAALYSGMFAYAFVQMDIMQIVPHVLALAAAGITLGVVALKGPWLIFGGQDVPALRGMPVRTGSIVISRLIGILLPELGFSLLMGMSAGAVLAYFGLPVGQMVAMTLALCLIPAMPTALALAIGTAVAHMTLRLRHRAAVSAALSMVMLAAVLAGCLALSVGAGTGSITEAAMLVVMGKAAQLLSGVYPPAGWLGAAMQGDAAGWAKLIASAVAALGLLTICATLGFVRVSDGLLAGEARRRRAKRTIRPARPVFSLYKKEWMRFASSSLYMMNTSVGWLMLLLAAAALCAVDVKPYLVMLRLVPVVGALAMDLLPVIPGMLAGMSCVTACAISMEGGNIELMRALPVRMRDWLGVKLMLHMTFAAPSLMISGAVIAVRLGLSTTQAALLIVYPLICAVFVGVCGLAINLKFPKFDWNQEAQVVKSGVSVLLTMLIGIFVPLGVGALGIYWEAAQAVLFAACAAELTASLVIWRIICRAKMP